MEFYDYIKPELLILIPVLYLIGEALKKSKFTNRHIPIALGAISVALSALYIFANSEIVTSAEVMTAVFTAITQGILVAGASVYANQIIKQETKKVEG